MVLIKACTNYRDTFLLSLLYETGMRIGEVLSLWLEDFDISNNMVDIKDRGNLENNAEIKTVSSPRRIDISQNIIDMFMESCFHKGKWKKKRRSYGLCRG